MVLFRWQEVDMKVFFEPLNGTMIEVRNGALVIIQVNSDGESSEVLIPLRYSDMFISEVKRMVG